MKSSNNFTSLLLISFLLLISIAITLAETNQDNGMGGVFGPGEGGFGDIPGFGAIPPSFGGEFGAGGGFSKGVTRPSVVCMEEGPCYMKKLRCPARCFTSYGNSGNGVGMGGGGGGCTMDCTKTCTAFC